VSALPEADASPGEAGRRGTHVWTKAAWLVLCCYLLAAVALTWRLWADPANRVQSPTGDISQFAWFMRYNAEAVAHWRLPALTTTAMNAPYGINLMSNAPSFLLPGLLLAPVTLLTGPQTSLTLALTLGFAGSAASMFLVLRRWGASVIAAALGGALYGFSPALVHAGLSHYQLQFAVLPPLIIDAVLRIVTGRGSAVRTGLWLGLMVAAQVFIGEEMLVFTAVAGVVLIAALAASRPREVPARAGAAMIGLLSAAVTGMVACGWALWAQVHGPVLRTSQWTIAHYRATLPAFVTPSSDLLFHTRASAAALAHSPQPQGVYLAYLGWPLIILLAAVAVFYWRLLKVRVAAVTFLVLEVFSLGGHGFAVSGIHIPASLLPWYWLQGLPVVNAALPYRFSIVAAGAAAAVLAFSLDQVRSLAPNRTGWRNPALISPAIAALAILPLVPLPYPGLRAAPLPNGWQAAFARLQLPPGARVLVVPVPYSQIPQPLRWQAVSGEPGSIIGGIFIGVNRHGQPMRGGQAARTKTSAYVDALWAGSSGVQAPAPSDIRADLAAWRPAAVVAVTNRASPLGRFLSGVFGRPAYQVGRVLAWRLR
jgi:hypothetical protein